MLSCLVQTACVHRPSLM